MSGNTPGLALPFPDPTDLIADGADAIKNLALTIENKLPYIKIGQSSANIPGNQGTATITNITTPPLQAPFVFATDNTGWVEPYFIYQTQTGLQLNGRNRGANAVNVVMQWMVVGWPLGLTAANQ